MLLWITTAKGKDDHTDELDTDGSDRLRRWLWLDLMAKLKHTLLLFNVAPLLINPETKQPWLGIP